jgi:ribonuclease PH
VLRADGGTRTAAITGSYVALDLAIDRLRITGDFQTLPILTPVAAISAGIVDGQLLLDLEYVEDSTATVDLNVVMTVSGEMVEVQGTAEDGSFPRSAFNELLDLCEKGIGELLDAQRRVLDASRSSG